MPSLMQLVAEKLGPQGVYQELHSFIPSLPFPTNGDVEVRALCPYHDDHDPSWCWNLAKAIANCPVCGQGGRSMVGFIAERTNRSKLDVLDDYCRRLGLPRPRQRLLTVADYARAKKLPEDFLRSEFQLRDSADGVIIPYLDENGAVVVERYRARFGTKPRWRKGAKASTLIYGLQRLAIGCNSSGLFICEGESDLQTASFHEFWALATPGALVGHKAMAAIVCKLAPLKVIIVAHADTAGWLMTERQSKALLFAGFRGEVRKLNLPSKDLSELHCESPKHFKEIILSAASRAIPVEDALLERQRAKEAGGKAFREIVKRVLSQRGLNPSDRIILITAAEIVAEDPLRPVGISNSKIAKAASITRRTMQNRLPNLVDSGLLVCDARGLRLGTGLVKDLH